MEKEGRDEKGRFVKGTSASGRPKGSVSKERKQLREFLATLAKDGQGRLLECLKELPPDKFVDAYFKLLEYCEPKLARLTVAGDKDAPITFAVNSADNRQGEVLDQITQWSLPTISLDSEQPLPDAKSA